MYIYMCEKCKKEFATRKKSQRFCSKSCANSINTSKRKIEDISIFNNGINNISAYILGLILSDGCLSYDKHTNRYRITISMNDYEVIEFLRVNYCPTKKMYEYKNPKGKSTQNNISCNVVKDSRINNSTWYVKVYKKESIELLYRYMYRDAEQYLSRKKQKFEMMI